MEKQELSKIEQSQERFNKTTVFLTKFIFGDNFDLLKKTGFTDSYTSDPEIMKIITPEPLQRFLFLLFKSKKLNINDLKKIITNLAIVPINIVFSYELVNDYTMVIIDFPEKFIYDYDNVVKGKYSRLSDNFKSKFPTTRDVLNSKKQRVGAEYTIYYHIFNKTDWLKEFWMGRLGLMELDDKLELWHSPDEKDLIFNINNII